MGAASVSSAVRSSRAMRDALVGAVVGLTDEALSAVDRARTGGSSLEDRLREVTALDGSLRDELCRALDALEWERPAAVRHLEWAPVARARLEAALAGVPDALLDARPWPGEWSIRQQLAHVRLTDIRYMVATMYGAGRRDDEPIVPPPSLYPPRAADPSGEAGQPLAAILADLRRVREEAYLALVAIPADRLQRSVEWHTAEHTVGFRLHRFAQHDLEMTTDVRATLAALGHRPTRAARLAAALVESWGAIEAVLLGVPSAVLDETPPGCDRSPASLIAAARDADAARLALIRSGRPL